jgi:hypothetical protein
MFPWAVTSLGLNGYIFGSNEAALKKLLLIKLRLRKLNGIPIM